jgi:hypothetical protein
MAGVVLDPLNIFTRVNLNLYCTVGNNAVDNTDPLGLDFASCYAECIEKYRDPVVSGIFYVCNAGLNVAVGKTGRSGFGAVKSHATSWQHKLGSKVGPLASKIGRWAGRAAVVLTVADGFFDLGLFFGCAAACDGE